jgi:hypothetical protein
MRKESLLEIERALQIVSPAGGGLDCFNLGGVFETEA